MAAPFCTGCGATIAEGTRFCVKCGKPVGQAPPPVVAPLPLGTGPLPVPPGSSQYPVTQNTGYPAALPVKTGAGAGVWIGIAGILLLAGGGGLWFYANYGPGAHGTPSVEVAAGPAQSPAQPTTPEPAVSAPAASPTPEVIPHNPDIAKPEIPPNPDLAQKTVIPPSPDFAKKAPAPVHPVSQPPVSQPPVSQPPATQPALPPEPARPAKSASPTSGTLHATVEVAQNGEVVFENLPGARLKFTFDHDAWQPTISHQANGTQTLVMRSLKPGIQTRCDVRWEIVR